MRLTYQRPGTAVVLALSGLLVTGCGSTVAMTSQASGVGASQNDGLGTQVGAPTASGGGTTAPTAADPAFSVPRGAGSGPSTPAVAVGAPTPVVPSSGPVVPVTQGPVKVGFFVLKDTGAAFAALGYDGLTSGNGRTQVLAAVKLINSQGGVGGRQITPVVYEVDASKDLATSYNEACATFVQDNKVAAVVSVHYADALSECTKNKGIPYISDSNASTNDASLKGNPLLVLPNQLSIDRASSLLVKGLLDGGWLSGPKKPVIGLITYDKPAYAKVKPTIEAALKQAGLSLRATEYMPYDDIGAAASSGKAAALKFQSEGVDHVLGLDTGFAMSWFTLSAGQQGYYPKLGMTSLSLPGGFPLLFNDQQLGGSAIVGWSPVLDTTAAHQPTVSTRTTTCLKAMTAAGEDMNATLARMQAAELCDGTWFLAEVFSSGTISADALRAGLAAMTRGFQSAVSFRADPRANRASAAAYRNGAYATSCKCYLYSGAVHAVS